MQAVVVSCIQERAPLGWLKRWKLSGPSKQVTRTTNCDHLSQAFRAFMALNQPAQALQSDSHTQAPNSRLPSGSKKTSRSAKKRSGSAANQSKHSGGFGSTGQSDCVRRDAEEWLARSGSNLFY